MEGKAVGGGETCADIDNTALLHTPCVINLVRRDTCQGQEPSRAIYHQSGRGIWHSAFSSCLHTDPHAQLSPFPPCMITHVPPFPLCILVVSLVMCHPHPHAHPKVLPL